MNYKSKQLSLKIQCRLKMFLNDFQYNGYDYIIRLGKEQKIPDYKIIAFIDIMRICVNENSFHALDKVYWMKGAKELDMPTIWYELKEDEVNYYYLKIVYLLKRRSPFRTTKKDLLLFMCNNIIL